MDLYPGPGGAESIADCQFLIPPSPPPHLSTQAMQSQMLTGGAKLEDVPAFRAILAREHRRIRGEEGRRWWGGGMRSPYWSLLARGWALYCT